MCWSTTPVSESVAAVRDKNFIPVFDQIIATNLRPYVELSHLSVPYLEQTNGTIISISSGLSMRPVLRKLL